MASVLKDMPAERGRDIWAIIEKYRAKKSMRMGELAKRTGISQSALYARRKKPLLLKIEDIFSISKALQIPEREIAEAYMGKRILQVEDV